ncbi:MAG TPA: SMP-30/gluconolactonase/LRE family protein [Verrucomicrobiae bacterium]|nr:SMP-30/gluconolactonase/LRE family protein [Verrucomicrobiae bacterium]
MNFRPVVAPILATLLALSLPAAAQNSTSEPGVPKGEVIKFNFTQSRIFPGTYRDYWIYVPAQYTPDKPACLYVNQDGIQWQAPAVFDKLIHAKEMPVTIGVFVMHGRVRAADTNSALDRFNRSYEYDGLGDNYARFLINELLPDVETKKTSDGRAIRLSTNATDRAIGGSSSGAICAFTAAWERPDSFSRVFSAIGTYVGLRGGDRYSTLVRKTEPKPIRIFLQDGSNDLNIYGGDWWMANQTMERALTFAGYEVEHVWGTNGHNGQDGTRLFPDAMRWLWKDWPKPVGKGPGSPQLKDILIAGEEWELVSEGYRLTEGPVANARGEVFFTDIPASKSYKIDLNGKVTEFIADTKRANGQAFGPDGKLYSVATGEQKILGYDSAGKSSVVAEGIPGNDIVVAHNGNIYVTQPAANNRSSSKVWLIRPGGEKVEVDSGLRFANGVMLSPDQTLLYVADYWSHWVYSYQIQSDGTLAAKQRYYWLHCPDNADDSSADGMKVDRDGRLYVATSMGIQVCDQAGRVNGIIPTPNQRITNLCFGGENNDTIYATCVDKVYQRKVKPRGVHAWAAPIKPPAPRL